MTIPTKLSAVTSVKNLRYVLNQSTNKIHRLIFSLGFAGGFSTIVVRHVASAFGSPAGHDKVKIGTLEKGVIPSWTGDVGDEMVSKEVILDMI